MSRLIDEIKRYQEEFRKRIPQEIQNTMLSATKKLEDKRISKNALKVGELAKDFTLINAVEKEVSLFEAIDNNDFVIISFYRGTWCPYCNFELKALQEKNEEFKSLGAKLIAISPQSPDSTLSTKEKHSLEFEVLSDTNNKTAKEYGLVFSLADELKPIYKSFGINIPSHNDEESYELPMPAIYVINKNKEIIFSFIDEDYTKRCDPEKIIDALIQNKF